VPVRGLAGGEQTKGPRAMLANKGVGGLRWWLPRTAVTEKGRAAAAQNGHGNGKLRQSCLGFAPSLPGAQRGSDGACGWAFAHRAGKGWRSQLLGVMAA
jgi:hypothetical protein